MEYGQPVQYLSVHLNKVNVSINHNNTLVLCLQCAARLIISTGKYDHIKPALCDFVRWLPVPQRIEFSCLTVSMVLALPTSKMSACRCMILLLGALSVRLSVVTCLFLEQKRRSSVDGVSRWLLRSSGIHYRLTYDHH